MAPDPKSHLEAVLKFKKVVHPRSVSLELCSPRAPDRGTSKSLPTQVTKKHPHKADERWSFRLSRDREYDLSLSVPAGGSFVSLAGIRQWKRAINGDASRAGSKQASDFRELWPVRAHLG